MRPLPGDAQPYALYEPFANQGSMTKGVTGAG